MHFSEKKNILNVPIYLLGDKTSSQNHNFLEQVGICIAKLKINNQMCMQII